MRTNNRARMLGALVVAIAVAGGVRREQVARRQPERARSPSLQRRPRYTQVLRRQPRRTPRGLVKTSPRCECPRWYAAGSTSRPCGSIALGGRVDNQPRRRPPTASRRLWIRRSSTCMSPVRDGSTAPLRDVRIVEDASTASNFRSSAGGGPAGRAHRNRAGRCASRLGRTTGIRIVLQRCRCAGGRGALRRQARTGTVLKQICPWHLTCYCGAGWSPQGKQHRLPMHAKTDAP